ncbi:lysine N(6)-hydroxylase/L-ornithine N(5)-oxygenase family protein [Algicola sagamiensis]|uniref:lysine N(6)-hydroxylase/L-ornithine N(5)-oxygenase family protein n=1 Tax=Algicola sagamiensis TaxID=163869 RepID=UPI000373C5EE|nr:SidA/IucD/PvdA family monooxygenase [Algicola sagamiensis]
MSAAHFDFIGIGIGPFNLGLASLSEPIDGLNGIFLDKNEGFDWHPGMMLQDATLQTPFMSDLVTLADPTNPLSFLNYIKQQGRMYSFYIRESFFLMRKEYNQYCQWATQQLGNLRFNTLVEHVAYDEQAKRYMIAAICTKTNESIEYTADKLVLGTGPIPYLPECTQGVVEKTVHSSHYLDQKAQLQKQKSITVLGSGQSAAEIFYDLLQDIDTYDYTLNWVTRSPRFFPLEYTKLTLEMTSPEYVDYFYDLKSEKRESLLRNQKHLYKGINSTLINDIFDLLYTKRLSCEPKVNLLTNTELTDMSRDGETVTLSFYHHEQEKAFSMKTEGLVLASGYHYVLPDFLSGISQRIRWDDHGRFDTHRNYSIDKEGKEIYIQNAELHTHGFVTPDLGMACYRNSWLIREITGAEHYPIETQIAFQHFGALDEEVSEEKATV